jgi:hypothetical protein
MNRNFRNPKDAAQISRSEIDTRGVPYGTHVLLLYSVTCDKLHGVSCDTQLGLTFKHASCWAVFIFILYVGNLIISVSAQDLINV